jgi:hypothetical protein
MCALPALYEPLLERDVEGIRRAAADLARERGAEELYLTVARFAVLAYAPSQHLKHAVVAVLAAHELREESGDRWQDLITECAIYAGQSRQPWSEPPILSPPAPSEHGDADELRAAVAAGDRIRGERWLAARIDDCEDDLLAVAAEDGADDGHKLLMTRTALRLAPILGDHGRFAALRIAVLEMTAYPPEPAKELAPLDELIARAVAEKGSFESVHEVFRYEASGAPAFPPAVAGKNAGAPLKPYALARDYAQYLEAQMVVKRLRPRHPDADYEAFLDAVHANLEASSYEEWSFA